MTRRSHSISNLAYHFDTLETGTARSAPLDEVVCRDDRTGELLDSDDEPAELNPNALMIVFNETVVVNREQAGVKGYGILGSLKDYCQATTPSAVQSRTAQSLYPI